MEDTEKVTAETETTNPGCSVDWSWLAGRKLASATNDLQSMTFKFEDGQTFKIQALIYKGEPFLAFTPYQDPNK